MTRKYDVSSMRRLEGIVCPDCGGDTEIVATRPSLGNNRRRRQCMACQCRFTTEEKIVEKTVISGEPPSLSGRRLLSRLPTLLHPENCNVHQILMERMRDLPVIFEQFHGRYWICDRR